MSSFPNNNRGGFAARRGRGGQVRSSPKSQPVKPDIQKYPLGQLLQSFYDYDFKAEKEKIDFEPLIVDCQYVASYNWLNHKTPTIMVPGKVSSMIFSNRTIDKSKANRHTGLPSQHQRG